jgi:hypothetical protein
MLKTISSFFLTAVMILLLVWTPVLVLTSHDHLLFGGGNSKQTIRLHTCGSTELHRDLHAGDTCLACLRAGLFVASVPADLDESRITPVGAVPAKASPRPEKRNDFAYPKRGPPTTQA